MNMKDKFKIFGMHPQQFKDTKITATKGLESMILSNQEKQKRDAHPEAEISPFNFKRLSKFFIIDHEGGLYFTFHLLITLIELLST